MFDLNQAIDNWKQQFRCHEACNKSDIDELESHLWDEIDILMTRGLSAGEAFHIASVRLGNPDRISCEYSKINIGAIWIRRLFWMVIGAVGWFMIRNMAGIFSAAGMVAAYGAGLNIRSLGYIKIVLDFALTAGVLSLLYFTFIKGRTGSVLTGIQKLITRPSGHLVIGLVLVLLMLLLYIGNLILMPLMQARTFGAPDYGRIMLIQNYYQLVASMLFPFLLAIGLVLKLRKSQHA